MAVSPEHPAAEPPPILTIGHSTRSIEDFLAILQAHGIKQLIDVRTAPGSRRLPWFNRDALAASLKAVGIAYHHLPGLGGFRKTSPESPNTAWRNASFRGYADYMQTPEFAEQLEELMRLAGEHRTAIMCSEAVPWRCHRSLIADALTVRHIPVEHIMSETKRDPHHLTSFAQVDGLHLTYPATEEQTDLFPET